MTARVFWNSFWLSALAIGALAFTAKPALAAAATAFSAVGSGVSSGATNGCSECESGHTCICVPITGTGTGTAAVIGAVTFSTVFVIDSTNS